MAIHFLSGKDKGKEIQLPEDGEIILGSSDEKQIVLDDPSAARKLARLTIASPDRILIRNLDSTNNIMQVNDDFIQESPLNEGDRVRLGKVVLMIIRVTRFNQPKSAVRQPRTETAPAKPAADLGGMMSGSLKNVSVIELLQMFNQAGKSGVLTFTAAPLLGKIYLRDGIIYYARINTEPFVHLEKALYRMLRWQKGTFALGPIEETNIPVEIDRPTDVLLLEGIHENDELAKIESELASGAATFIIARPFPERLRNLPAEELDLLQLVLDHGSYQAILDHHDQTDLDIASRLLNLVRNKMLVANRA